MKISTLLSLLITLTASPSISQRSLIWYPDTSLRVTGSVAFDKVRVIDDRRNKASIGFLIKGKFSGARDLQMEDSVARSLEKLATRMLHGAQTVPGELLIVLRDLRLEDAKGSESIGTVHLRADLFTGSANKYLHLKNFDTLYEKKRRRKLSKSVKKMGSAALLHLLMQTKDAYPSGDPNVFYTLEGAVKREHAFRQSLPVYSIDSPRRGIYNTANDFLQLQASDTSFIDERIASMDAPTRFLFYRKDAKGKRGKMIGPDDCFAIYDGKGWYVARRSGFSILNKEESGDFYTALPLKGLTDRNTVALAAMGFMFAPIVGAAVAISAASYKRYPIYRVRMMPDAGKFAPVGRIR